MQDYRISIEELRLAEKERPVYFFDAQFIDNRLYEFSIYDTRLSHIYHHQHPTWFERQEPSANFKTIAKNIEYLRPSRKISNHYILRKMYTPTNFKHMEDRTRIISMIPDNALIVFLGHNKMKFLVEYNNMFNLGKRWEFRTAMCQLKNRNSGCRYHQEGGRCSYDNMQQMLEYYGLLTGSSPPKKNVQDDVVKPTRFNTTTPESKFDRYNRYDEDGDDLMEE